MNPYLALLIGVVCAGIGGELFVRGLVGLASWARVSAAIVATTVAAFATSSPELSVAVGSALSGRPEISLGDALGSNVVNVALILAVALCMSGIVSPRASVRRDFPVALLVPVAVGALGFDGRISRTDGIALLVFFLVWLIMVINSARQERNSAAAVLGESIRWRMFATIPVGLAFLIGSGHFIVLGARDIAVMFGLPEFVIGATIVAVGTSMPELATTVISKLRGHEEIGLGTVLGSNVFNGLFIVGTAAVICPIHVELREVRWALGFGVLSTLLTFPRRDGLIPRWRGVVLLALYAAFVILVVWGER
ncbi:MAG: sodium:calcium antiporter [Verrucomicrobia bacterium]|nr:sodium:calcium antiporter [Verrucomicrobiota bacterium]